MGNSLDNMSNKTECLVSRIDRYLAKAAEGYLNRWRERLTIPVLVEDEVLALLAERHREFGEVIEQLKLKRNPCEESSH